MFGRLCFAVGAAACAIALAGPAAAASGAVTGDVHLRTGPGTQFGVITTIPAGAPIEVYGCQSWCQVNFNGREGYVSGNYVAAGYARYQQAPIYVQPAPPPVVYFSDGDRWNDNWYGRRHYGHGWNDPWRHRGNGVGFYFGF